MANAKSGNSVYIDSTGSLETDSTVVVGVILTATAANAVLALTNSAGTVNKLNLRVPTSGDTVHFDFAQSPIHFPAGIAVGTLTNAIATLIYTRN